MARNFDRPRVLLVEDDLAVRNATRLLLRVDGYQVETAGSLAEAFQKVDETGGFDLLVTDYHLARGETGLQVIAALRERLREADLLCRYYDNALRVLRGVVPRFHYPLASY